MNIAAIYRSASKELALLNADRQLLQRLLRELATNTVQRRLSWNIKEQFITLWFISAGRFPELPQTITDWIIQQLPFKIDDHEIHELR
jgi:hypothetical protein